MEILGIGPLEALFILIIALIAVGPRDLGRAAQSIGRFLNQVYRSEAWRNLSEASRNLRSLPNRLAREAALDELDQARKDIQQEVRDFAADVNAATDMQGLMNGAPEAEQEGDPKPSPKTSAAEESAESSATPPGSRAADDPEISSDGKAKSTSDPDDNSSDRVT
jgi:Sec-independent protein translocase protein TatA